MKAKEYLSQAKWLDKMIDSKIMRQERLRTMAEKTTISVGREKVSGGTGGNPMESAIVKLVDLSHEINDDIDELIDLQAEIKEIINKVDDFRYRLILEMRYINNKDWAEVAKLLKYDTKYTIKLHGRAIKEIDLILEVHT